MLRPIRLRKFTVGKVMLSEIHIILVRGVGEAKSLNPPNPLLEKGG